MKTKKLWIITLAVIALTGCSKDNGDSPFNPGDKHSFWGDSYLQNGLYGKVKTIKESTLGTPDKQDLSEFNEKGLKTRYVTPSGRSSITYKYDQFDRLIRVNDTRSFTGGITEFTYTDKHNFYMPTSVDPTNLGMAKGLNSFSFTKIGSKTPGMTITLKSVNGQRLTFTMDNPDYESSYGGKKLDMIVDFKGEWPQKAVITSEHGSVTNFDLSFYSSGKPATTKFVAVDGDITSYEFVDGGKFLLIKADADGDRYTYDSKENWILKTTSKGSNKARCEYIYDKQGNWTEQKHEKYIESTQSWVYDKYSSCKREYTYW